MAKKKKPLLPLKRLLLKLRLRKLLLPLKLLRLLTLLLRLLTLLLLRLTPLLLRLTPLLRLLLPLPLPSNSGAGTKNRPSGRFFLPSIWSILLRYLVKNASSREIASTRRGRGWV